MRHLIATAFWILALCTVRPVFALDPFIGTNVLWISTNHLFTLYSGGEERLSPFVSARPRDAFHNSTNRWAQNFNYRKPQYQGRQFDQALYEVIPFYLMATNLSANFYEGKPLGTITNWTHKAMYEYLRENFVNTDGTRGVGIYTNNADGTSTNWYWTQTWQTSAWSICLGTLTYSVLDTYTTNGVQHYRCGWVYGDGDRLIRRMSVYSNPNDSYPAEWGFWWQGLGEWWEALRIHGEYFIPYGLMFDWADTTRMSNVVTVSIGSRNWTTLAADDLSLLAIGTTNYTRWVTNTFNVTGVGTSYHAVANNTLFDLGYFTHNGTWNDGLVITNTADVTNFVGANHIGDKIKVDLWCGSRLYQCPVFTNDYRSYNNFPSIAVVQPWADRRVLNERAAVLSLLRVSDAWWSAYPYQSWYEQYRIAWTSKGETNSGGTEGWASHVDGWAHAVSDANSAWGYGDGGGGSPGAETHGEVWCTSWIADGSRTWSYLWVPLRPGWSIPLPSSRADFWVYAKAWEGWQWTNLTWDANGDGVLENQWHKWDSITTATNSYTFTSTNHLGSDPHGAKPNWCAQPPEDSDYFTSRGWAVQEVKALMYWDFVTFTNGL